MRLKVIEPQPLNPDRVLQINPALVTDWIVAFLRHEVIERRGFKKAIVGISGGIDSAVVAYLCARAFGPNHLFGFKMPYEKVSSPKSAAHADLVIDALGCQSRLLPITGAVDGYLSCEPEMMPQRLGNVCARIRTMILFDQAAKLDGLPIGTGNKSERLLGYFTWHADDAPPINPIGDLLKTQVFEIGRYLGIPQVILDKPPSADLVAGQTDEGDFGITYAKLDRILFYLVHGYRTERLVQMGFPESEIALVRSRLDTTHWKRHLPTVCVLSDSAIGEYYLRPVDY